jgi:hypothetical protein
VKRAYLILALAASLRADALSDVLQRMDQAAQKFRSLSADVRKTDYTDVLSDTTVEEGTFKLMKSGKEKFILLADFKGQDAHVVQMTPAQVKIYHPKANSVEIYETRKYTKAADQYLMVGFGTTAADLQKTYAVTLGGTETVNGVKTTRLDLAPKSAEAKKLVTQIQLWIPEGQANPIQEKMLSGKEGKDYKLFQFSNTKIRTVSDPALPASDFDLKLPAGVKEINAGK